MRVMGQKMILCNSAWVWTVFHLQQARDLP